MVAQNLRTGARRVLAEDATADFASLALEPRTLRPLAASATLARRRWQVLDPAYAADFARLATVSRGDLGGFDVSQERAAS